MFLTVTRQSGHDLPCYLLHADEDAAREFLARVLRELFAAYWGDDDPSDILIDSLSAWDPEEGWTSLIGHAEEIEEGALAEYHPISAPGQACPRPTKLERSIGLIDAALNDACNPHGLEALRELRAILDV